MQRKLLNKQTLLNTVLFILVICLIISYVHQEYKIHRLKEEISLENKLGEKKLLKYESYGNRHKLCEEELQTKRAYIQKCMDLEVKLKQHMNLTEEHHERLQQILKIGQEKMDECFEKRNGLKSKYLGCFPKDTLSPIGKDTIFKKGSPVNKIKSFVLFLGYSRSGGSIIAALLDAHPHVVISNQFQPVEIWNNSQSRAKNKIDRYALFTRIMNHARSTSLDGKRSQNNTQKYYTLAIPGLYQGQYKDYIRIIGDKKGGSLVKMDNEDDSEKFLQMLERFQDFVGYPLKLFHIVRNPYDNIATKVLYDISREERNYVFMDNITIDKPGNLASIAKEHIDSFIKIQRHIDYFGKRMLTLNQEDMITNPILFLKRMCNHMEIYCSNYYLEKASKKVFSTPTQSRHSVGWTQDVKTLVESAIKRYSFLKRYSFES